MYRITGAVMAALLVLMGACTSDPTPPVPETPPVQDSPADTMDERLLRIGKDMPGFGGMFFDDNGDLNVYVTEDVQTLSVTAREAQTAQAMKTISSVFGEEFLRQGRRHRLRQGEKAQPSRPPRIKLIKGDYEIGQLVEWRAKANRVLELPGTVLTDLDESRNRLKIGVESSAARKNVTATLDTLGIPREAVVIEITKPIKFNATLKSRYRSMPGGVQIEADTGVFASKTCTMGFNAIRAGVNGFVTNSHCTETQGGSEGTDFHQPDDPLFSEGNKVGDEIADPLYTTGGACPSGRRCRYSDSAFIDYTVSRGKDIARTTGWNNGSLTVSTSNPRLTIIGETTSWAHGSELDKIGRTTGWTYGRVSGTCENTNVSGTNITLLCQYRVNRIPGQTHSMADNGDSGSPVFRWLGTTVELAGILWGSPVDDNDSFVFSPIHRIEQELGPLTTFNFSASPPPPPPPPPSPPPPSSPCSSSQKCCGSVDSAGNCLGQCVPKNSQCP